MKKIACLLSAVLMLAGAAQADMLVFDGVDYDVFITDPVSDGTLISFELFAVNTTAEAGKNPSGIGASTTEAGAMGFFGDLHQNGLALYGITSPMNDSAFADAFDTHFLFGPSDVISVVAPAEDGGLAASPMGGNYSFGSFLIGDVGLLGGNASATWSIAQFVLADPGQPLGVAAYQAEGSVLDAFFKLAGQGGNSEDIAFALVPVPEPATMSLLAIGGVAALIRRRK